MTCFNRWLSLNNLARRVLILPPSFGCKKTRTNLAKVDKAYRRTGAGKIRVIELLKFVKTFQWNIHCKSMKLFFACSLKLILRSWAVLTVYSWYSPSWGATSGTSSSFFIPGTMPVTWLIRPPAMPWTTKDNLRFKKRNKIGK